jgi:hypothetical protein
VPRGSDASGAKPVSVAQPQTFVGDHIIQTKRDQTTKRQRPPLRRVSLTGLTMYFTPNFGALQARLAAAGSDGLGSHRHRLRW